MVYVYHTFLIHLSADGHLGWFHVLAIINSPVMNIGVHVSLKDMVFLVLYFKHPISSSELLPSIFLLLAQIFCIDIT